MSEHLPPPTPAPAESREQVPVLLSRIERQLARIADALEAMAPASVDYTKDLGPTRTMPKPLRR